MTSGFGTESVTTKDFLVPIEYFSFWSKSNNASRNSTDIGQTITTAFQKLLNESNYIINKIWVDKGSDIYNRVMKFWLHDNNFFNKRFL